MRKPARSAAFAFVVLFVTAATQAATFIVPSDREIVQRSHAIVIGSALTSYTQLTPAGGVETLTPISVEEVISGAKLPDRYAWAR